MDNIIKMSLGSWYEQLDDRSINECTKIISILDDLYNDRIIYPTPYKVFRAFRECNYDNLKVVLLGQDPYPNEYNGKPSACGLCFVTENGYINPSLRNLLKVLKINTGGKEDPKRLLNWPKEGVLMLNTALSVEKGVPLSHMKLWQMWTKYLVDHIIQKKPKTIWILLGNKAQKALENRSILKVMAPHPSPLAGKKFLTTNIFNETNKLLNEQKINGIAW